MSEQSMRLASNKPVTDWVWDIVRQICDICIVLPGNVFSGGANKEDAVMVARHSIARLLRRHIASHGQASGYYKIFANEKEIPRDWPPISYPVLGELLGCSHSTFICKLDDEYLTDRIGWVLDKVTVPPVPKQESIKVEPKPKRRRRPPKIDGVEFSSPLPPKKQPAPVPEDELTTDTPTPVATMPKIDGYHSTRGLHETHRDNPHRDATPLTDGHDCV